jgi:hypothetical protein
MKRRILFQHDPLIYAPTGKRRVVKKTPMWRTITIHGKSENDPNTAARVLSAQYGRNIRLRSKIKYLKEVKDASIGSWMELSSPWRVSRQEKEFVLS